MADLNRTIDRSIDISRNIASVLDRRIKDAAHAYAERIRTAQNDFLRNDSGIATPQQFWQDWYEYTVDFAQRAVLFWDTLRQRGNNWIAHEQAGKPPLLAYKYEVLADARTFERPVGYALVRIVPPRGIHVDDALRPFIIIDPRAGHGPGIGGMKHQPVAGHLAAVPGIIAVAGVHRPGSS